MTYMLFMEALHCSFLPENQVHPLCPDGSRYYILKALLLQGGEGEGALNDLRP